MQLLFINFNERQKNILFNQQKQKNHADRR